jgi:hypothetical protein
MASIYIRDVPEEFYWKLKDAAHSARKSFKSYVLESLASGIAAELPEPKLESVDSIAASLLGVMRAQEIAKRKRTK